jgi:trehalose 6-phosphate phosphatase
MQYIFSAQGLPVLHRFASGNTLLAFDFDGTLAPIVSEPDRAAIRLRTRRLLKKLTPLYPCIVVSGRSRDDVRGRVHGLGFAEVIGNHGIEPWGSSEALARTVRSWVPVLKEQLAPVRGVVVEEKQFSVSVHYRKARRKKATIRAIHQVAKALPGARLVGGKQVVNIVPKGAPHKGHAVEDARRKQKYDAVIYIGDDDTDENAFDLERTGRVLGVRVGGKRTSLARSYIRNQEEIDRLLATLIAFRTPPTQ